MWAVVSLSTSKRWSPHSATRTIAGAGLDVFVVEPLPPDDPLIALDNVILTPHWSASTSDVWRATGSAMAEGMIKTACGERPDNVVNPQVFDRPEFRVKLSRFRDNLIGTEIDREFCLKERARGGPGEKRRFGHISLYYLEFRLGAPIIGTSKNAITRCAANASA